MIWGLIISILLLVSSPVHAVCPLCTIAVGAGLGLSRYLGIDDTISGLWIGGLIMSFTFWMRDWLNKRWPQLQYSLIISFIVMVTFTIVPLYLGHIIGHAQNIIWGIDKILFGIVFGMGAFLIGYLLDKYLRQKNGGKVYMYYQKVILPVSALFISSGMMYAVIKLLVHG